MNYRLNSTIKHYVEFSEFVSLVLSEGDDSRLLGRRPSALVPGNGGSLFIYGKPARDTTERHSDIAVVPPKWDPRQTEEDFREQHKASLGVKTPRWKIERTHECWNRLRAVRTRFARKAENYEALRGLSCVLIIRIKIQEHFLLESG